ncbi:hypothetical protein B0H16DRAFT_1607752 [Mycena metata]|uniref:Protein kinase domain-containing protein n=1 Tax=Mycena metata TaxID=1033252 RepID=A0AAD7MJ19_9AGAR|nr:hypothetical protein B0H16DRAFT_1607752 [Mycena metata]
MIGAGGTGGQGEHRRQIAADGLQPSRTTIMYGGFGGRGGDGGQGGVGGRGEGPQISGNFDYSNVFAPGGGDIHYHAAPSSHQSVQVTGNSQDMRSLVPVEIYTSQLLRQQRGFPLYNTGPQSVLPQPYRDQGISIGDMGRVTPEGIFDFFFNVFLPRDHPINNGRVPEDFVPLPRYALEDDYHHIEHKPGSNVSSSYPSIQETDPGPVESSERTFSFHCRGPIGALLILQRGSKLKKLENVEQMRQYAEQNAESWYKYVNGPRGRNVDNGALCLVTGREKTQAGGLATFHSIDPGAGFSLSFTPSATDPDLVDRYEFNITPARTETFVASLNGRGEPFYNQTVFLHGFSISLGYSIWNPRWTRSVRLTSITDSNLTGGTSSSLSPSSQGSTTSSILNFFGLGGRWGSQRPTTGEKTVTTSPIAPAAKIFHPSHIINDHILREAPDARVVISHDDDWSEILRDDTVQNMSEFLQRVSQRFEIVGEGGVRYLKARDPTMNSNVGTLVAELVRILDDQLRYPQFLGCRGPEAQTLIDLLQDLLDIMDTDSFPVVRPVLLNALLQLCQASVLSPSSFECSINLRTRLPKNGGGFGDIYKEDLDGRSVAVKVTRIFPDQDEKEVFKQFTREVLLWRQLSHPRVLPFFGANRLNNKLFSVSPWMENGDVPQFWREKPTLAEQHRLSFILDVALGLQYLHEQSVLHGDLKGRNILVTPSMRACICDFGVSLIALTKRDRAGNLPTYLPKGVGITEQDETSFQGAGTTRYMAPELFQPRRKNFSSDVYGFACTGYEILTGKVPFHDVHNDVGVHMLVIAGTRPSQPTTCSGTPSLDGLWSLLEDCWATDPEKRPTAAEIVAKLEGPLIQCSQSTSITSGPDWEDGPTAKFRRSLQIGSARSWPSVAQIDRISSGRNFNADLDLDLVDGSMRDPHQV